MASGSGNTVLHYLQAVVRPDAFPGATDAQLLARFAALGDEQAFALLVRRHGPMVFALCQRALRHAQDAENAFQATFLVLARKAGTIRRGELLANWLYGVALRIAAKARAGVMKRQRREEPLTEPVSVPAPAEPTDFSVRPVLDEEVGRLPAKYRTPFVLCYLQGLTNAEAARQLGCPKGTLQSRLAWARRRLRSRLTRRGVVLSAGLFATLRPPTSVAAGVPPGLAARIVEAALIYGGWKMAVGGVLSPRAAALAQGVLHTMFLTKVRIPAILILASLLSGAGVGRWMQQSPAAEPGPAAQADDPRPAGALARPEKPADNRTVKEVVKKTFQTGAAPHLVVETFNGPITVTTQSSNSVEAEVTKQAQGQTPEESKEALQNIRVDMTQEGDTVRITAKRKEEWSRQLHTGAAAEIKVPQGAILELRTSNGPVTITGGTGGGRVRTSNGAIRATENRGSLHLATSNGSITVSGAAGTVDAHTSNGGIDVRGEKVTLAAGTSNGSVRFRGNLADGAHHLHTANGNIDVTLPKGSRFRMDVHLAHGKLTNDFPPHRGESGTDDRPILLKLGAVNGTIAIHQAP
jgi:RNA polymerase sigma factor (sigma-70 family)